MYTLKGQEVPLYCIIRPTNVPGRRSQIRGQHGWCMALSSVSSSSWLWLHSLWLYNSMWYTSLPSTSYIWADSLLLWQIGNVVNHPGLLSCPRFVLWCMALAITDPGHYFGPTLLQSRFILAHRLCWEENTSSESADIDLDVRTSFNKFLHQVIDLL
jgi:hypothetical protein